MVAFIDHAETATPAVFMYVLMFLIGFMLGTILLGIGLYRARVVPRWAAGLIVLGMAIWIAVAFSPADNNVVAIATVWVLISAGFGAVGAGVLSMADRDWESLRATPVDAADRAESPLAQGQVQAPAR
jgi:peptidoglycan/LPS O-acetylase OafA/YrhL